MTLTTEQLAGAFSDLVIVIRQHNTELINRITRVLVNEEGLQIIPIRVVRNPAGVRPRAPVNVSDRNHSPPAA